MHTNLWNSAARCCDNNSSNFIPPKVVSCSVATTLYIPPLAAKTVTSSVVPPSLYTSTVLKVQQTWLKLSLLKKFSLTVTWLNWQYSAMLHDRYKRCKCYMTAWITQLSHVIGNRKHGTPCQLGKVSHMAWLKNLHHTILLFLNSNRDLMGQKVDQTVKTTTYTWTYLTVARSLWPTSVQEKTLS